MKKLFAILGGTVFLLALAIFVAPYLIPQSMLERQLAPMLAKATGLELQEAQRLRLSVYPAPGIAVEGVRARMPVTDGAAPIVRADRIHAALRPGALLQGRAELERVTFENPSTEIHLSRLQAQGRAPARVFGEKTHAELRDGMAQARLIRTSLAHAAVEDTPGELSLPLIEIVIANGSATLIGAQGPLVEFSRADLTFESRGAQNPVTINGLFFIADEEVTVEGVAGPPQDPTAATQLLLQSDAGRTAIDGTMSWKGAASFSGRLSTELTSGAALGRMTGADNKLLARFDGSQIEGRLDISDRQISLSNGVLTSPGAKGNLAVLANADGTARARLENLQLHGGTGKADLNLDPGQSGTVLAGTVLLENVDALSLSGGLSGFDWISGRASTNIELAAGGESFQEMRETLTGNGRLSVRDGAIEGLDLPALVADAQDGEFGNFRREAGRRTPFDRMTATFRVEDGVARTDDLMVEGPNLAISGEGRTNFVRERIKYRLRTAITARADADGQEESEEGVPRFVMPVVVEGPWAKPQIYPDLDDALKDKESLRGTAKLFGKSVEKLTGGQVKSDEFGEMIDGLFGKKKKDNRDGSGDEE